MNECVEILKRQIAENLPNYGSDAKFILVMYPQRNFGIVLCIRQQ